jgi:hypothetical protein
MNFSFPHTIIFCRIRRSGKFRVTLHRNKKRVTNRETKKRYVVVLGAAQMPRSFPSPPPPFILALLAPRARLSCPCSATRALPPPLTPLSLLLLLKLSGLEYGGLALTGVSETTAAPPSPSSFSLSSITALELKDEDSDGGGTEGYATDETDDE